VVSPHHPIYQAVPSEPDKTVCHAPHKECTIERVTLYARVHSFGHLEKHALFKARAFSSLLKSARFEKRELLKSARLYPMLLKAQDSKHF
jgi:hypothetical protein